MGVEHPAVGIIMGSANDWKIMQAAAKMLKQFRVPFEARIVSAHRTPDLVFQYSEESHRRGLSVIIAGAGGAAHLPGMVAAKTTIPVLGVPIPSTSLNGLDSLLSIVQMPKGIPVATLAIGEAGAENAALLAISILGIRDESLRKKLEEFRLGLREKVLSSSLPED